MAGSTISSTPALTSPGIGSGLDINSIVERLMAVEQRPLALLDARETRYQTQLTGYGALKGALAALQGTMQGLASAAKFQGLTAKAADPAILAASAASSAAAGSYELSVANLAQSQVLAGAGVASMHESGSTGTLTLQVGSGAAVVVTVDATNNSLAGLRDAINAAKAGVTASIVNDGGASPYRLVLTAAEAGAANAIQVTNNLTAGAMHDVVAGLAQVRPPLDAALTVNGVPVTSASNSVASAIPGVTVTLLGTGDTTLTVARDGAAVQGAVASFVKAYNDVNATIASLTAYNAETKQGGVLLGDATARNLQSQLRATLGQTLAGVGGSLKVLSQIGVSFQKNGSLALDSAKLAAAVDGSFPDIAALFSVHGRTSNPLLAFVSAGNDTPPGAYQVNITAAATQGAATAANPAAASTVIDGTNDGFSLIVNGIASGPVTLAHGTYTASQLAAALQSAINGAAAYTAAGITVAATLDAGRLVVTSQTYGGISQVSGGAGSALAALGFDGSESGFGANVAGNFVLDGTPIEAVGSGQILSAVASSTATSLRVKYAGTPAQAAAGPSSTLNFSEGFAVKLQELAAAALAADGALAGRTGGLNASVKEIDRQRESMKLRLEKVEANYRAQFTALDTLVANLNSTSNFLTQQLAGLSALSGGNR